MAIRSDANDEYITRAGSFDPKLNWTIAYWLKIPVLPGGGEFRDGHVYGDGINFTNPYIAVFVDTSGLYLEIYDGTTFNDTTEHLLTVNKWYFVAYVYNATTHVTTLYLGDGASAPVSIGTLSVNLSSVTFVETAEYFCGDPSGDFGSDGGYIRNWQRALTLAQLNVERQSMLAVLQTNLISDTPLLRTYNDYFSTKNWTNNNVDFVLPKSYLMKDGDTTQFLNQDEGTLFVVEEINPDSSVWSVTYNISSGDPRTDIIIVANIDISVVVLNQKRAFASGLYFLVPGKRNDTVYNSDGSTIDVAKPNPYFETGPIRG